MIYEWKPGRGRKVSAEEVGRTIDALGAARGGVCPPHELVEVARPSASALHPLFEWDDSVAAERYRIAQARDVTASIVVRVDADSEPVPAFFHVKVQQGDFAREGYTPIRTVVATEALVSQVREEITRQIRALQRRYAATDEYAASVLARTVEQLEAAS